MNNLEDTFAMTIHDDVLIADAFAMSSALWLALRQCLRAQ